VALEKLDEEFVFLVMESEAFEKRDGEFVFFGVASGAFPMRDWGWRGLVVLVFGSVV
jgi:hypothetical protein